MNTTTEQENAADSSAPDEEPSSPPTGPVPVTLNAHVELQPSSSTWLPSSHASLLFRSPSPHPTQLSAVPASAFPRVQVQACSTWQSAEHPSPLTVFPSSHPSRLMDLDVGRNLGPPGAGRSRHRIQTDPRWLGWFKVARDLRNWTGLC